MIRHPPFSTLFPYTTLSRPPLVLPRSGTPLRRIIEDGLRRRGIGASEINVALETDGLGLAVRAVRDGMGLAFVPQTRRSEEHTSELQSRQYLVCRLLLEKKT